MNDPFAATTALWPEAAQDRFRHLRAVILNAAAGMDAGEIAESLKWGEPAWRPKRLRQGSTLRAAWQVNSPRTLALFVDCKTTLAATMRDIYPDVFTYENNRALRFDLDAPVPADAVDHLARLTFAYHLKR
ncbi:DUF1801 domain-containing protein [Sulfitobacter sp. HNIBRBA3233]|uniref:DUF1801 domain-containing protein n=1 Tax=Sulfitobacter marinivivus TaxID=3158558 RepID=UPI0032DEC19D